VSPAGVAGATPAPAPARRVIVMARLPRLGRVKTRLAASIGPLQALRVHRELLAAAVALVDATPGVRRELRYAHDGPPGSRHRRWLRALAKRGWSTAAQRGGDLGQRMCDALDTALRDGDLPVLIGCDCPAMRASDLLEAFHALRSADAVFAPTEDGGYALVGLARSAPHAFDAVAWGTAGVMVETRRRLARAGLRWHELRTLWDVDVEADLRRWRGS
jgi:rSAM/selenodomain-associated transferase 1